MLRAEVMKSPVEVKEQCGGQIESLPWPDRQEIVRAIGSRLDGHPASEEELALLEILSRDPKFEIRKEVADLLLRLPAERMVRLAVDLAADMNRFVRRTAERALRRQRKAREDDIRAAERNARVHEQLDSLERQHGKVTARKALGIAERMLDQTVGAVVHDALAVLSPIQADTMTLVHHVDSLALDPSFLRKRLTRLQDQVGYLQRLLDDARAFSRPLTHQRSRERLADLMRQACTVAREHVRCLGFVPEQVEVVVNMDELITLDAARHVLLTALVNVIKNAYDAILLQAQMADGGQIDIEAHVDGSKVVVSIADNGHGIHEEDLELVRQFVPGRTTKKHIGTGFGLPIAHKAVASHDGRLLIESQRSVGTTITMELPLHHPSNRETQL